MSSIHPHDFQTPPPFSNHALYPHRYSGGFTAILGKALWKIDNIQALDSLVNALSDEDWRVRFTVVIALGSMGNPRAIDPLAMLLMDTDSDVRFAAEQAIETLKKLEH
jgi:HEAT repeat protein